MTTNPVIEALAAYAHDAWAGWMRYLFGKSQHNADGSVTIPAEYVTNLKRLMDMPYQEMPEKSKDSDRIEARKMLSTYQSARYRYPVIGQVVHVPDEPPTHFTVAGRVDQDVEHKEPKDA